MSTLPKIIDGDRMPILRFSNDAAEDRRQSDKQGRIVFKDIIKVFVRAAGDTKCETPFIAKDIIWEEKEVLKEVPKKVKRIMKDEKTGEQVEVEETVHERVIEIEMVQKVIRPWLDQLKEKLKDKLITQRFYDYCEEKCLHFEKHNEVQIEGTPIAAWNQITPAQQKTIMSAEIYSVEQLADANEEGLRAIGLGGRELKRRAQAYITASDQGRAAAVNAALEKKATDQQEQIGDLQSKIAELTRMMESQPEGKQRRGAQA